MKEIGGFIEFYDFDGNEYHITNKALDCARNALAYLIESRNIKKLYIPLYLCDSISDTCDHYRVPYEYYCVERDFLPKCEIIPDEDEYFFLVNYYGQINNDTIKQLHKRFQRIIVDNSQAFYQKPVEGIDTIYSCRKFFGVADGAYLYSQSSIQRKLDTDISFDRMTFLLGRYEKSASEFYPQYVKNNEVFSGRPIKNMSKLTHNLLRAIDYETVKDKRTSNFEHLHQMLFEKNELFLSVPKGAFMYPFLTRNGAIIRKKLQSKRIYIPTLWPNVPSNPQANSTDIDLSSNILPLPCDQRYSLSEMEYIAKEVLGCLS